MPLIHKDQWERFSGSLSSILFLDHPKGLPDHSEDPPHPAYVSHGNQLGRSPSQTAVVLCLLDVDKRLKETGGRAWEEGEREKKLNVQLDID